MKLQTLLEMYQFLCGKVNHLKCWVVKHIETVLVVTRGTKSGKATPRSAHESFDIGPGN